LDRRGSGEVACERLHERGLEGTEVGERVDPELAVGVAGAVAFLEGEPVSMAAATVRNGRIVELDFLPDPEGFAQLDLAELGG
jgi:hypothetical protein